MGYKDERYNILYDLRIAANAIGGAISNLDSNSVDHNFYMAVLKGNYMRMKRIMNNAEDIENIKNKVNNIRYETFNISEMIEEIVAFSKRRMPNSVTAELHLTANLYYSGDYDMIHRVLTNLICNSIKFTEKSTPCSLEISARYMKDKSFVKIKFKDRGLGIPKDKIEKIFSRMEMDALDYCINVGKGSGLGLAYVKEAVALHGGTISVTSSKKNGTEFTIILPVRKDLLSKLSDSYVHFNDYIECEYYDIKLRKGEILNARSSK